MTAEISPSSLVLWLHGRILTAARDIEKARNGRIGFEQAIYDHLRKNPIQEWEADRWLRGVKRRLVREQDYFFRAGDRKRSPLSLFVRNEQGLNVGFRREAITQLATYVSLITDFGYPRTQTRFESRWMDVAVYGGQDRTWLYAENKADNKTLQKLCARLESEFADEIPYVDPEALEENRKVDDAVMKANHIFRNRPSYFWGVSPSVRKAYRVQYRQRGFVLSTIEQIPDSQVLTQSVVSEVF